MNQEKYLHQDLAEEIIKSFYNVYNELNYGFLEKVYLNAMLIELKDNNLIAQSEKPINIYYKNHVVGIYFPDIVVNDTILIELKAVEILEDKHVIQMINYLKVSKYEVGLVLNFGKSPEINRKIYTNDRKKYILLPI